MNHASPFTVLEFVCQDMYELAAKNRAPKAMPTNRPAPASSPPSLPAPVPKATAASPPLVAPATWRLPVPPPPEGFPARLGLRTTVLMVDCVKDLPFRMLSLGDLRTRTAGIDVSSFAQNLLVVIPAFRRCLLCLVFLGFSVFDWLNRLQFLLCIWQGAQWRDCHCAEAAAGCDGCPVDQWRLVVYIYIYYMCLFAGWVEHLVCWQGATATSTHLASWATCRSSTWAWLPLLHDALNSSSSR